MSSPCGRSASQQQGTLPSTPPPSQSRPLNPASEFGVTANADDCGGWQPTQALSLRLHPHPELSDQGARRAAAADCSIGADADAVGDGTPAPLPQQQPTPAGAVSLAAVAIPNCLSERLEVVSYALELALRYDASDNHIHGATHDKLVVDGGDSVATTTSNDASGASAQNPSSEGPTGSTSGSQSSSKLTFKGQRDDLQGKMLLEMLELDSTRALDAMEAWSRAVWLRAERKRKQVPQQLDEGTWDEYVRDWMLQPSQALWYGLMTFGLGISLTEEEREECFRLCRGAFVAFGLREDLLAWDAATGGGITAPEFGALNLLIQQGGGGAVEARRKYLEIVRAEETEYAQNLQDLNGRDDLSAAAKEFVCQAQHILTGFTLWAKLRLAGGANAGAEGADAGSSENGISDETGCARKKRVDSAMSSPKKMDHDDCDLQDMCNTDLPEASTEMVMAPFHYLKSLPSKGVREKAIDALNIWVGASAESISTIKVIVGDVHALSLMLDDFEDNSPLRRSRPATHGVFGVAQTVNSANFQIVDVIGRAAELNDAEFQRVVIDEMKNLLVGQSMDLYWTYNVSVPTVREYLQMVDGKTGGLFRMISRLMVARSELEPKPLGLDRLMTLLGRYFQIRDDYSNLVSDQYTAAKGFAEDLDEGKCSLILMHALEHGDPTARRLLSGMMQQRRTAGCAGPGHKELILGILEEAGSLAYTAGVLGALAVELVEEIGAVERATGKTNAALRGLVEALRV
ncbi:geranylgeranyl pyrophosphate synthase [Diplodia corticola]|uniref:Geranylgeranyl pyrophosphate synthase n=1 Tax=Diplodia corticola TaxID=236234 RepID=A0A1J9R8C5_9PEZI|nr:geranylgeranyl pyrophosphate synthase [Diplodia corticola]OJD36442.1 geranylgeranyl pyrophosphate synthase [Diplodia corticola]